MFILNRITIRIPCDPPAMRLRLMRIILGPCSSKYRDYEEPKQGLFMTSKEADLAFSWLVANLHRVLICLVGEFFNTHERHCNVDWLIAFVDL